MRLRWSSDARLDLREAAQFIATDNPRAAEEVENRILAAADRLLEYPNSGRIGLRGGTRELVIKRTPYLLVYRVSASVIEIVRVWHTSREPFS